MRLFTTCPVCKRPKLYINKRAYQTKTMGAITSKDEQCWSCYRSIKKQLKKIA